MGDFDDVTIAAPHREWMEEADMLNAVILVLCEDRKAATYLLRRLHERIVCAANARPALEYLAGSVIEVR